MTPSQPPRYEQPRQYTNPGTLGGALGAPDDDDPDDNNPDDQDDQEDEENFKEEEPEEQNPYDYDEVEEIISKKICALRRCTRRCNSIFLSVRCTPCQLSALLTFRGVRYHSPDVILLFHTHSVRFSTFITSSSLPDGALLTRCVFKK